MITITDTIRWLHGDGLKRLAGIAGRLSQPIVAYTIDVATGAVTAHPETGVGLGSETLTMPADDLPFPDDTAGRLVVVGVTPADTVVVIDLAATPDIAIHGAAEGPARSWAMQLLLNPTLTLATSDRDLAVGGGSRYRHRFVPGGAATTITVDDNRTTRSVIRLNPTTDDPDHLDLAVDGSGELYLGARFWRLRQVLRIDDAAWSALTEQLNSETAGTATQFIPGGI